MNNVKSRVKELRARYNLTQAELARIVGVRRETIIHLEKRRYTPSLKLAYLLAKALKCSIDDLFIFGPADFEEGVLINLETYLNTEQDE